VKQHPEGTLFVNGDEAGLLRIAPNGTVENFNRSHICSFQPPAADFAFDRDGSIYYSEAAPGFTNSILKFDVSGKHRIITNAVGAPAGIEVAADGSVYYADYGKSAVMQLHADGRSTVVAENIPYPVGLAVDNHGRIWVGAAELDATGDPYALDEVYNTRILRFTPGKQPEEVMNLEDYRRHRAFTFFDVDDQGNLYVPDGDRLLLRTNTGEIRVIAGGFRHLRGACVCRDGSIVVTDYGIAALYRLRRK
jgi:streptogramin lyase